MSLISAVNSSSTSEAFLSLITIETPDSTIRVVNNTEDIVSRGETFYAYPFSIELFKDSDDSIPSIQLMIDNTDLTLMDEMRSMLESPKFKFELVLSSDPDTVEKSIMFLELKNIQYDSRSITGSLTSSNILSAKFPSDSYTSSEFPGLYYT